MFSSNSDMSTKNLKYLSSEQALADLAYFIESKTREYKLNSNKWIVFGGSYPGSLAAWFRLKYPHLAYGAVASSAPLLAKINFKGNCNNRKATWKNLPFYFFMQNIWVLLLMLWKPLSKGLYAQQLFVKQLLNLRDKLMKLVVVKQQKNY